MSNDLKPDLKNYFIELIGSGEAEQFFSSIKERTSMRSIRVNSLRKNRDWLKSWLEKSGYSVTESSFSKEGLSIEGRGKRLSLKLPYHAGFTYPQDESSMFAVELLDPQPGEYVIDLTSAPGGKSTHIAQKMMNEGVLLANDMDSKRLKALHANLERLGIFNTVVTRSTPHKLSLHYTEMFDRVLLDPSCSGEGLYVTHEGQPDYWNLKSIKRYATDQFGLLCSAFRLLKPGGRLVYSTCTLNEMEDDSVVARLLEKFPEAQLDDVTIEGQPKQLGDLIGIRFWPHITHTKGFFCVAITKTESVDYEGSLNEVRPLRLMNKKQSAEIHSLLKKQFGYEIKNAELTQRSDRIYLVSEAFRQFPVHLKASLSMPFIDLAKHEKMLSHAAALQIGLEAEEKVIELSEEEALQFFESGVEKDSDLEDGTYLVRYTEFPLGLGTVKKGRMTLNNQGSF